MKTERETLQALQLALSEATDSGLLDKLAAHVHPDVINGFCDAVSEYPMSVDAILATMAAVHGVDDEAEMITVEMADKATRRAL